MTQALFTQTPYETSFEATVTRIEGNAVELDKTLFYATSGGQPGDLGMLQGLPVLATVKDKENPTRILHILPEDQDIPFSAGDTVSGTIDWDRRYKHMQMHTALHILCSLINGDVTGGQIGEGKSRLDFNLDQVPFDKETLTKQLNERISENHQVTDEWIDDEELDKNPTLVRTLSVKPPRTSGKVRLVRIGSDHDNPIDLQPCGGTHVANTSEIRPLLVSKIENKGKMNKRVVIIFDDNSN